MSKTKSIFYKTNLINLFCYIALAIICIIANILTKNLFLQFLLTCLSIFFVYDIAIFFIYLLTLNKVQPKIVLPSPIIALSETTIQLILPKRFIKYPCVSLRLQFKISDNLTSSTVKQNLRLDKKNSTHPNHVIGKVSFECGRHGNFTMDEIKIIVSTYFSATGYRFRINSVKLLTVSPIENVINEHKFELSTGDDTGNYKKTLQTSMDFFDNRKYYPGDDPRRINWKVYAHINELQIRQAEKTATNFGNQNIIFAPYSDNLAEYEAITAVFIDICNDLIKKDIKLNIYHPNKSSQTSVDKITTDKMLPLINQCYAPFGTINVKLSQMINSCLLIGSIGELNNILAQTHPVGQTIYTSSIRLHTPPTVNPWLYINNSQWIAGDIMSIKKQKTLAQSNISELENLKNLSVDNNLIIVGD